MPRRTLPMPGSLKRPRRHPTAIEKELARVQADIESAAARQEYLRKITETMKVDIHYNGMVAQADHLDLPPIDRAIHGSGRTIISSVAALISFIAAIIPWFPLIAFSIWGVRRGLRRWKSRKTPG